MSAEEPGADETLRLLRRMVVDAEVARYSSNDSAMVVCPYCPEGVGANYTSCRVVNLPGNDSYDASGEYGLRVRGDVKALEFESETCLHRWALAFGFHKGATFVTVTRLPDRAAEDPEDASEAVASTDELARRRHRRRRGEQPKNPPTL